LAIRKKHLGQDNPDLAPIYSNIGNAYDKKNAVGKALEFHQKALDI